jgi:hypothetical protein
VPNICHDSRLLRRLLRLADGRRERLVVQLPRRRAGLLLALADVDRQLLIELHQVGRNRGVGETRAGPLAAFEGQPHGVGRGHVHDLVDERLDFVA